MVSSPSLQGEAARVFLCSQLHFFLALDEEWTTTVLKPLFDWTQMGSASASQVWQGYLIWARLNDRLIRFMLPQYMGAIQHLSSVNNEWRDRFTEHLALIATHFSLDPMTAGWLATFISGTQDEERAMWSRHVMHNLHDVGVTTADALWEKWIRRYLRDRSKSLPRPVGAIEGGTIAGWISAFQDHFSQAVDAYLVLPPARVDSLAYHWLEEADERLDRDAVARLMLQFLKAETRPFYSCHDAQVIAGSLASRSSQASDDGLMTLLTEEFLRLDCRWPNA
jgi:hypothetical protein